MYTVLLIYKVNFYF